MVFFARSDRLLFLIDFSTRGPADTYKSAIMQLAVIESIHVRRLRGRILWHDAPDRSFSRASVTPAFVSSYICMSLFLFGHC